MAYFVQNAHFSQSGEANGLLGQIIPGVWGGARWIATYYEALGIFITKEKVNFF